MASHKVFEEEVRAQENLEHDDEVDQDQEMESSITNEE